MWRENDFFFLLHNNQYALYLVALFLSLMFLTAASPWESRGWILTDEECWLNRNMLWHELRKSYCCVINHTCHTGLKLIQLTLCWWDKPHFRKCASLWNCIYIENPLTKWASLYKCISYMTCLKCWSYQNDLAVYLSNEIGEL